jgi:CheY-like chemotaxis protein
MLAIDRLESGEGLRMARMLVVDDEKSVRHVLVEFLKSRGHQVREAGTGAKALSLAAADRFDVIFLDIMMPIMNGIETLKRLREVDPNAAVIMISGSSDQQIALEAVALGAYDHITKPFDFAYLDHTLSLKLAMVA